MEAIVTGVSAWVTAALGWIGDIFEYLTSADVIPYILLGIGLMAVGMGFKYVRSLLRG